MRKGCFGVGTIEVHEGRNSSSFVGGLPSWENAAASVCGDDISDSTLDPAKGLRLSQSGVGFALSRLPFTWFVL